jgi:hypothetical protein
MTPSPGRIVLYTLTAADAIDINRRRRRAECALNQRPDPDEAILPGAMLHAGNTVDEGDVFPAVIIRVFSSEVGTSNLQVLLDGNDTFWATSRGQVAADSTDKKGLWSEPPRV